MKKNIEQTIKAIRKELKPETILETQEDEANESEENRSQAQKVVDMVIDSNAVLFRDQFNKTFIAPDGHGGVVIPIRSQEYQRKLCYEVYQYYGKPFQESAVKTATSILDAKALHEGDQNHLHVRVMNHEQKEVWYDLGDGRVVLITQSGWQIVETPPIIFKRYSHQGVQCAPVKGGNVTDILQFFNIEGFGEDRRLSGAALLAMIWIIVAFVPGFPHAILVLHGANGAGKSSFFRYLKRLIDPSALEGIFLGRDTRELIQMASHHWFLPFDNVTDLTQQQSDMLCRFCTGEGTSKRELYSDDNDVIYRFKVVMGLNGINLMAEKGDLLDRCVLLPMKRIEHFQEESKLDAAFEKMKPGILGAIFDIIVIALQKVEVIELTTPIRLADFARWGCAVAEAMGYSQEDFLEAYRSNIWAQNEETLDASPVAKAIIDFMDEQEEWKGSPNELYSILERIGEKEGYNHDSAWPNSCRSLWKRINEVLPSLQSVGIKASRGKDKKRYILLHKHSSGNAVNDGDVVASPVSTNIGEMNDMGVPQSLLPDVGQNAEKAPESSASDITDVSDNNDGSLTSDQVSDVFNS